MGSRAAMNLETAVGDDKVMQDFESELFSDRGRHSPMVKAPPIKNDDGSKDCVNLSSPTVVSRLKAVFLDRDGVLIEAIVRKKRPYPPKYLKDVNILPFVPKALELLRKLGFRLIVVTNQPDVARGKQTREKADAIHAVLTKRLLLDEIRVCYHDDADSCSCRKPAPGLLLDAARDWNLDLSSSYMVGDRWRDMEAGERAGCRTVFIDYGYDEKKPAEVTVRVKTLFEAALWIALMEAKCKQSTT